MQPIYRAFFGWYYEWNLLEKILTGTLMLLYAAMVILAIAIFFPVEARRTAIDNQTYTPDPRQLIETLANSGQAWVSVAIMTGRPDGVLPFLIPFKLDVGAGPEWQWACVAENGFLWLVPALAGKVCPATYPGKKLPATFIAADFADFAGANTCTACHATVPAIKTPWDDPYGFKGNVSAASGVYELAAPYALRTALPAAFFTWYDTHRVGTRKFATVQVVITDRAGGDFDIDFNWTGAPDVAGIHGLRLGRLDAVTTGAQTNMPDKFCFRGGAGKACK